MINCPKCHVPNTDTATACAACGTTLAGQQFAQAMDQAQQSAPAPAPQPTGQVDPAAQPPPAAPQAPPPQFAGVPEPAPIAPAMDAAAAQMEINKFVSEQRARKRMKTLLYLVTVMIIAGVLGFFYVKSARRKARIQEVAEFFSAFRLVDDEETATFWKCGVRARHRDVRLAKDTLEITDGLEKAFSNFPKSQPDHLKNKCVPMIAGIMESLDKLKPPTDFEQPLEGVKVAMKKVATVYLAYADKIDQRKQEAINEQEVRNCNQDFHIAQEQKDVAKALPYYNLLNCAVPELDKNVKLTKKAPNTQYIVEYIYNTCKEDPTYADKLRKECFDKRNENAEKTKGYREAVYQMSGDNRDLSAINDCFKRANRGFDRAEIEAIAKVFVTYRTARGEIIKALAKVKKETAE